MQHAASFPPSQDATNRPIDTVIPEYERDAAEPVERLSFILDWVGHPGARDAGRLAHDMIRSAVYARQILERERIVTVQMLFGRSASPHAALRVIRRVLRRLHAELNYRLPNRPVLFNYAELADLVRHHAHTPQQCVDELNEALLSRVRQYLVDLAGVIPLPPQEYALLLGLHKFTEKESVDATALWHILDARQRAAFRNDIHLFLESLRGLEGEGASRVGRAPMAEREEPAPRQPFFYAIRSFFW